MNRLHIRVSLFGALFLLLFWCDGCGSAKIPSGLDVNERISIFKTFLTSENLNHRRQVRDTQNIVLNVSDSDISENANSTANSTASESVSTFEPITGEPEPTSTSEPYSEPETQPSSEPTYEPTSEPKTEPTDEPITEPNPTSEPESTPEPTNELITEPESTQEPVSEPVSTSEPKSESTSEPEPTSKPESTPEPESTAKPELTAEPESTADPKPTSEPETTAEPKPTSEPELTAEPESTAEPRPTSEPGSSSEPKPTSEPESTAEPKPTNEPEPTSEPESTAEPRPTSEPESTAEPRPTSEPKSTAEPRPTSEPESTSEPRPTSEPESTSEPEPTSEPESSAEPEVTSEPHPKPENSTAEPTAEPELISEPTPESGSSSPEPEVEPTSDPESEPEPEGQAFAEPHPEWDVALKEWQWGWEVLVYFFASVFLLLAGLSLLSVIRLWKIKHLLSKNYFMVLNILIIFQCVLRALYLLIDPYNMNETYHPVLSYFLYSTAFPCLTSAFSILFYALLLATKMKMLSSKIQKSSVLIGIIAFHFVLSIATDFVVGFFADAKVMLLICQFFYILWGIILFAGYVFIFRRLRKSAINRRKTLKKHSISYPSDVSRKSVVSSMGSLPRPKKSKNKSTLNSAISVTLIAAACGIFCIILELFGMFYVFRVFTDGHVPEPWPWYVHQFLLRVFEIIMCAIMIYVGSQPIKYNRRNDSKTCYVFCFVMKKCCCSSQENGAMEMDQNASFGSSHCKSASDSEYESSDAKSSRKKSKNVIVEQNGNGPQPCKHTHIVIEEGLVRFRSEDELTDGLSDRASSLPDLLHGKAGSNPAVNTGMCNMAFNSNGNVTSAPLHRTNTEPSDMMEKNLGSVGTIGTIGANIPSINLAHSLQWEFDKAYDRSFQLADDNDDTPPAYSEVDMEEPAADQSTDKTDSSDGTDDSCGPASPSRLPLIKDNDTSTDDVRL